MPSEKSLNVTIPSKTFKNTRKRLTLLSFAVPKNVLFAQKLTLRFLEGIATLSNKIKRTSLQFLMLPLLLLSFFSNRFC